ncbi:hypothetical protein CPB85DRAFT_1270852 [Mucidula mucida]|nr:hypothetical protein CPB85DRAFT_1270852 [Mucidula mucida]
MATQAARRGVDTVLRSTGLNSPQYILLKNIPHYLTPFELNRFVLQKKLQGVSECTIIYDKQQEPTGTALLTHSIPNYVRDNFRNLQGAYLYGRYIDSEMASVSSSTRPDDTGTLVVVAGLNGKAMMDTVARMCEGYTLAHGDDVIRKVPLPTSVNVFNFTLYSRWVVRFANESEAHRFIMEVQSTKVGSGVPLRAYIAFGTNL